ncbi:hypothetical protein C4577_05090 [Candidatus Parcubacteria bacterium]|nr:MAG: hypothetical protein C4577_05090 [Candidatus Parcubacteria bacterium]
METIKYDFQKGTVIQYLCDLDSDLFTGTFDEIEANIIFKKLEMIETYQQKENSISSNLYEGEKYCDGTTYKTVKFDSFYVESYYLPYSEEQEFAVYGVRKILPEEYEAVEAKKKAEQEAIVNKDREVFENLKKKHGWS